MESVSGSLIPLPSLPPEGLSETVQAWMNICPHAGRRLDWAPGKFLLDHGRLVCAAHGAMFELEHGECIAGPCRGQSLVPVAVVAGEAP